MPSRLLRARGGDELRSSPPRRAAVPSAPPSDPAIKLTSPQNGGAAYVEVTGLSPSRARRLRDGVADRRTVVGAASRRRGRQRAGHARRLQRRRRRAAIHAGVSRSTRAVTIGCGSIRRVCRAARAGTPRRSSPRVGQPAQHTTPSTVVARVYPTSRRRAGKPAAHVHRVLGADGAAERHRAHEAARRERTGDSRARFCRSTTSSGAPITRASPRSSIRAASRAAFCRTSRWGARCDAGRSVTLVIGREWRDQHGLPLKEDFRRVLRVGPAEDQPLDTATWRIQPPAAGGRDGLVVTFPKPLDHGAADARARRHTRRRRRRGRRRRRQGGNPVDVHAAASRGARAPISCSRSTSSRMSPAIRSAARSRWTTSTPSTRAPTPRASRSRSRSGPPQRSSAPRSPDCPVIAIRLGRRESRPRSRDARMANASCAPVLTMRTPPAVLPTRSNISNDVGCVKTHVHRSGRRSRLS